MAAGEGKSNVKRSKSTLTQEKHPPSSYVGWSSAMQAYYGAGVIPPFPPSNVASSTPYPYIWGRQQPTMPPYTTPIPYPAQYSGFYAFPTMPMTPQPTTEMEIKALNRKDRVLKIKRKGSLQNKIVVSVRSGEGVKVASISGNNGATLQPSTEMEMKARNRKERASKINRMSALQNSNVVGVRSGEGEKVASSSGNDCTKTQSVNSENDGTSDAVVPNLDHVPTIASILNMGIDLWNPSAESVSVETTPTAMIIQKDGRELKRQKRKQSNRESATRLRQRKQDEWEEQQAEVYALSVENHTLGDEIRMLSEECNKLRSENNSIMDKLKQDLQ